MQNVNDEDFELEVKKSNFLVLVDFWAPWCGPCLSLAPILEELSKEFEGRVKFVKVNVDDSPEISSEFAIRSIPTMLLFSNGVSVSSKVGALSKSVIKDWIDSELSNLSSN